MPTCFAVADRYPGVVELSAAVSCERGYELALGAALAQHPGALAIEGGQDQWSLLEALRSAGVRLVRLLAPARRQGDAAAGAFPGALPRRRPGLAPQPRQRPRRRTPAARSASSSGHWSCTPRTARVPGCWASAAPRASS